MIWNIIVYYCTSAKKILVFMNIIHFSYYEMIHWNFYISIEEMQWSVFAASPNISFYKTIEKPLQVFIFFADWDFSLQTATTSKKYYLQKSHLKLDLISMCVINSLNVLYLTYNGKNPHLSHESHNLTSLWQWSSKIKPSKLK